MARVRSLVQEILHVKSVAKQQQQQRIIVLVEDFSVFTRVGGFLLGLASALGERWTGKGLSSRPSVFNCWKRFADFVFLLSVFIALPHRRHMEVPGLRIKPHLGSNQCHYRDNARSLTLCATMGTPCSSLNVVRNLPVKPSETFFLRTHLTAGSISLLVIGLIELSSSY